jgi:probable F420-dependent oxidoreductase
MLLGTRLYGVDPDAILAKARKAEELGFDSVWRGDHLIVPTRVASPYPHAVDGGLPFPLDAPILDVLTVLGWVAQATTALRLATGILVLPLREPVLLARQVLTLDVLSKGRVTLGVASGWLAEEIALVGGDFAARGEVTDDRIRLLRELWTAVEPSFAGAHHRIDGVRFEPKPTQRPSIPIVGGGESPAALRRAATLCDGWYGHRPTPERAGETVTRLRRLRAEAGLGDAPFEVTIRAFPDEITRDALARFEEAGVDRVVAEIGRFEDIAGWEDVGTMERVAERALR